MKYLNEKQVIKQLIEADIKVHLGGENSQNKVVIRWIQNGRYNAVLISQQSRKLLQESGLIIHE